MGKGDILKKQSRRQSYKRSVMPWLDVRGRGVGQWAFMLHRFTGIALFAYLILHIKTVSSLLGGQQEYTSALQSMYTLPWLIVIALIFAAGIFHGANGLRVILGQFDIGVKHHKAIFWILLILGAGVLAYSVYMTFWFFHLETGV